MRQEDVRNPASPAVPNQESPDQTTTPALHSPHAAWRLVSREVCCERRKPVDKKEVPLMQSALNIAELVLLILAILVGFAVMGTLALVLLRLLRTKRVAKKHPERNL